MKTILTAALCLLLGFAGAQTPGLNTEFDKLLQELYKADGPGAAALVSKKGKIIYKKAFGLADLDKKTALSASGVFRIGSITKQFTAAAILQLAEQGKISLQDDLTKFIPDYPAGAGTVTIEHLLTHTSGIKSYTGMLSWTPEVRKRDFTPVELINFFKNEPADFEPGAQWRYNNSGYVLLGYILEKVSGLTYADYIQQKIFKPLGMRNSYYDLPQTPIKNRVAGFSKNETTYAPAEYLSMTQPYAAGSLASTVEDLLTWTTAVHAGKVVGKAWLDKAFSPYVLPDGTNTRYGYGWVIGNLLGSPTIEHGGGINGFVCNMIYLPEEEICVAVLTNCDCISPDEVSAKMAALAAGKELAPQTLPADSNALKAYAGVYENEKKEARILTIEGNQLYSQRGSGPRFKLFPFAPDAFYFENSLTRAKFVRAAADGKITQLNISDRRTESNAWVKTDKAPEVKKQ